MVESFPGSCSPQAEPERITQRAAVANALLRAVSELLGRALEFAELCRVKGTEHEQAGIMLELLKSHVLGRAKGTWV